MVNVTPRPLYSRERYPVPIVQATGWDPGPVWTSAENLASTGIRSPDRLVRNESLYRLHHFGPQIVGHTRADEPMASGIHCCPNFSLLFLLPNIVKNMYVGMYACVYTHTHIYCVQTVYELPSLPNSTAVKHLNTNLERCEVLAGYLSLVSRPGCDWANT